jgi:hypothetical protein
MGQLIISLVLLLPFYQPILSQKQQGHNSYRTFDWFARTRFCWHMFIVKVHGTSKAPHIILTRNTLSGRNTLRSNSPPRVLFWGYNFGLSCDSSEVK